MNTLLVRIIENNGVINLNNIKRTLAMLSGYTGRIEFECNRSTYLHINGIQANSYSYNYRVGSYTYIPPRFLGHLITRNDDIPCDYIQIKLC